MSGRKTRTNPKSLDEPFYTIFKILYVNIVLWYLMVLCDNIATDLDLLLQPKAIFASHP